MDNVRTAAASWELVGLSLPRTPVYTSRIIHLLTGSDLSDVPITLQGSNDVASDILEALLYPELSPESRQQVSLSAYRQWGTQPLERRDDSRASSNLIVVQTDRDGLTTASFRGVGSFCVGMQDSGN